MTKLDKTGGSAGITDRFDRLGNRIATLEQTCDHRSGTLVAAILAGVLFACAQVAFDVIAILR